MQNIRLAAHLAVFNVRLLPARGRIHRRFIPLPASRALEAGRHPIFAARIVHDYYGTNFHAGDRQVPARRAGCLS
jgi:hypothetical protein